MGECKRHAYASRPQAFAAAKGIAKSKNLPENSVSAEYCAECNLYHVKIPKWFKAAGTAKKRVDHLWPRRADGTPVQIGDYALTANGDGFVVHNIRFDADGVVLGSGHGYGRRLAYGDFAEIPTDEQMVPYLRKWQG